MFFVDHTIMTMTAPYWVDDTLRINSKVTHKFSEQSKSSIRRLNTEFGMFSNIHFFPHKYVTMQLQLFFICILYIDQKCKQ
jgi:hypothetical protein